MTNTLLLPLLFLLLARPMSSQDASCVSVRLAPDKAHHKLNELFSFRVSIENCGTENLYVERYANLAGGGNLILNVHEAATGRKIYPHFANITDVVPPFDEEGNLPVVLLGPGHSFDNRMEIKVRDYFRKAGKYTVTLSYISILPKSATRARPVWDQSQRIVQSNPITVVIE